MMHVLLRVLFVIGCCGQLLCSNASATTLVREGRATAMILLPKGPLEAETLAAKELVSHLKQMSGADIPQKEIEPEQLAETLNTLHQEQQAAIVIGRLALPKVSRSKAFAEKSQVRGAFILKIDEQDIFATGVNEGTHYAALELLEQLGCRWFMPGDLGTVVPEMKTVTLKSQEIVQAPSFPSRWFQMPDRDWQQRVRCGGDVFVGGHGIPAPKVKVDKTTGEITPAEFAEFFALNNGKRTTRQHCISNPKFLAHVIAEVKQQRAKGKGPTLGMGPNDGRGFCECENCKALDSGDYDAFSGEPSVTDRYIWFFNQILAGVNDEYPDTKLAFYIYHSYMRPPLKNKPDPRIVGAVAPISLDRVHGFSNPIAPEKSYAKWLFSEWGKIMPELYDRGYWSNLACPGFPFVIVHRLRDEIPACHELGVKGWRVETFPNYAPQFPSMYVAGKLMWDHTTDVDALLADCFDKFFGPAAKPMGQYITLMDSALRDGDFATGSSWDMPHFYPQKLRDQARKLLEQGRKLAPQDSIYAQRVQIIRESFDMLEAFIEMLAARTRLDFVVAKQELEKLDTVANRLMETKPIPMLSAGRFSTYVNYMKRFYRPCTEQGFARVTNGNKLVAKTQDEWAFQIDPLKVGEEIGLYRAGVKGGGWQTIKTSSSSWSNQGLRYYKGLAWYRQSIDVPAELIGQRVFFWCGGVDELAKVWINGKLVGISHGAAFYPFELDASEMLNAGRNEIVIAVSNATVNELGTGGIVAPVMLYAPSAGKDAKLENVRDLKPTFP